MVIALITARIALGAIFKRIVDSTASIPQDSTPRQFVHGQVIFRIGAGAHAARLSLAVNYTFPKNDEP